MQDNKIKFNEIVIKRQPTMGKELQNNYNSWSINQNTMLPNDELHGEEENIMRVFHEMRKLEVGVVL